MVMQQKQRDEYSKSENFRKVYVTDARGGVTPYDFRVTLFNSEADLEKSKMDEVVVNHHAEVELILSHNALRSLARWLNEKVNDLDNMQKGIEKHMKEKAEKTPTEDKTTYIR